MATSQEYERAIIDALAVSDSNMNTALGTPVRKIISAVAGEMAKYAVDVNTTQTLYALDAVSGTELDYLVGQFGFTRQEAKAAKGTITIKRDNGDDVMHIAYGAQFSKPATSTSPAIQFQTTSYQELGKGVLSAEIAIVAITPGSMGNVPANTITHTGTYSTYVTVTNAKPTIGGRDAETDADLRIRFLNTVFRNVAGTRDQYAGLAEAHEDVDRVNVIGQESRYTEIVQVQSADTVDGNSTWRTYYAHPTPSVYELDVRNNIDMAHRLWVRKTDTNELLDSTMFEYSTGFSPFEVAFKGTEVNETMQVGDSVPYLYALKQPPLCGTALSISPQDGGSALVIGTDYTFDADTNQVTFLNVNYAHAYLELTYESCVVAEGDYVTIEFDYISKHKRYGDKSVDVYVDGEASQLVSDIQFLDFSKTITQDNASQWVRKDGTVPDNGNGYGHLYLLLSRQPLISSTGSVNVGTSTILKEGVHFNVLYDTTTFAGSRDGVDAIELIGQISGEQFVFDDSGSSVVLSDGTPMNVPYYYNTDIGTIQSLLESQSVMTMDTLVHAGRKRLFAISLDVMYSARPKNNVATAITDALRKWADGLPFGATVQVSDIEATVANVTGVDNVKLAADYNTGGIIEYALDGTTPIPADQEHIAHLTDFLLAQDELFVLQNVMINDKSQQNW